jgi:hypothetical protein
MTLSSSLKSLLPTRREAAGRVDNSSLNSRFADNPESVQPVRMTQAPRKPPKRRPRVEILDKAIIEVLRRKSPAERLEMVFAANRLVRARLEGHLRSLHPDWDAKQIREEIARRVSRGTK